MESNNVDTGEVSSMYDFLHPVVNGLQLYGHWSRGRGFDGVLYGANTHDPGVSQLLLGRVDLVPD